MYSLSAQTKISEITDHYICGLMNSGGVFMLYFLQEGPAQTSVYLVAGYTVIFGVMALYLISLVVRRKNLQQDLETLQEIESQENDPKSNQR
jgi:hypothetical protein